ncbi:MAG: 3'-5' exonuclease [Chloroflexaceae bacterium]|jgi:DNA polymerase-3 subunit epsilon|nr:3'-5' exonuclease [Chloroflexaceae bacterium]
MFFFRRPTNLPPDLRAHLDTPRVDGKRPWREVAYSVLDVETSGLDHRHDALLAIGLVEVEAGRVRLDRHWYSLVRPPAAMAVSTDSIRVHGLLRRELHHAPPPEEVLPELLRRLHGQVLVVHVATIDVRFINQALQQRYGVKLRHQVLDTARLAQSLSANERFISGRDETAPVQLRALAAQANLPVYGQHNALNDAITTAQLFLAQATRLEAQGYGTLRGLLRAGRA